MYFGRCGSLEWCEINANMGWNVIVLDKIITIHGVVIIAGFFCRLTPGQVRVGQVGVRRRPRAWLRGVKAKNAWRLVERHLGLCLLLLYPAVEQTGASSSGWVWDVDGVVSGYHRGFGGCWYLGADSLNQTRRRVCGCKQRRR